MYVISKERKRSILNLFIEGNSIRSISRLTDTSPTTILTLLRRVGKACRRYHDQYVRKLRCQRVQVDEIWTFRYAKRTTSTTLRAQAGHGRCLVVGGLMRGLTARSDVACRLRSWQ